MYKDCIKSDFKGVNKIIQRRKDYVMQYDTNESESESEVATLGNELMVSAARVEKESKEEKEEPLQSNLSVEEIGDGWQEVPKKTGKKK